MQIYSVKRWETWFFLISMIIVGSFLFYILTGHGAEHQSIGKERTTLVVSLSFVTLLLLAGVLFFSSMKVILNDEKIAWEHPFFPNRALRWSEIGYVRTTLTTTPPDVPSTTMYELVSRNGKKALVIGPWIKNYHRLLREIMLRVPPDCIVDGEVLEAIKKA